MISTLKTLYIIENIPKIIFNFLGKMILKGMLFLGIIFFAYQAIINFELAINGTDASSTWLLFVIYTITYWACLYHFAHTKFHGIE